MNNSIVIFLVADELGHTDAAQLLLNVQMQMSLESLQHFNMDHMDVEILDVPVFN